MTTGVFETAYCAPFERPVDVYREHQHAWAAFSAGTNSDRAFLYRWDTQLLVRSSSILPASKRAQLPKDGSFKLRMLCARQSRTGYVPVSADERTEWLQALLHAHGIEATDIQVDAVGERNGIKADMLITLPVVDFHGRYCITDYGKAWPAFRDGLGRAKRFGCGMLICE